MPKLKLTKEQKRIVRVLVMLYDMRLRCLTNNTAPEVIQRLEGFADSVVRCLDLEDKRAVVPAFVRKTANR